MRRLRERVRIAAIGDRGMTLIEVMVAMFVFAIISTMVLSSLLQIVAQNRHSRSQHVAANLAAAEIDLALGSSNLFLLDDSVEEISVDGTTYRVARDTEWVTEHSSAATCGAGDGDLHYKRVHVSVTWSGMRDGSSPVRADTVVNPAQSGYDPTKGTVLVSVLDSAGEGVPGAEVTLKPSAGGTARPVVRTDARGCAYVLQIPAGNYSVSVFKSGYVGIAHTPIVESLGVAVGAGSTQGLEFQYDRAVQVDVRLAPGASASTRLPTGLHLNLTGSNTTSSLPLTPATMPASPITIAASRNIEVHPGTAYRAFVGTYGRAAGGDCVAPDPAEWLATSSGTPRLQAGRAADLPNEQPGASVSLDVPMGLVHIGTTAGNLRATPASAPPGVPAGTPSCTATHTYSFGNVSKGSIIALPFGTWKITNGNSNNVTVTVVGRSPQSSNVVTLDPRQAAP